MDSLRKIVESSRPQYTESIISAALKSYIGQQYIWIIVEGYDDVQIYRTFFSDPNSKVMDSEDKDGHKGWKNVETIVTNILGNFPKANIFGIRDKDYTSFEIPKYQYPANVFHTDYRDIETTILVSENVTNALIRRDHNYSSTLSKSLKLSLFIGYIRIYNHVYDKGIPLNKNLKKSVFWDDANNELCGDWKEKIIDQLDGGLVLTDLEEFIQERNLTEENPWDICRGHDVIKHLQYYDHSYGKDYTLGIMLKAFTFEEFKKTFLYEEILRWAEPRNLSPF